MATKNHCKLGTYKTGAEYATPLPRNLSKENVMTNMQSKERTTTFLIVFLTLVTFNLASFQATTAYADTIPHKHNNAVNKIKNSTSGNLRQLNEKKSKNGKNQNAFNSPQAGGKRYTSSAQKKNQLFSHSKEKRSNKNKKGNISPILNGNNGGAILTDPHGDDQSGTVEQPSSDSHSGNSLGADYSTSDIPSKVLPGTHAEDHLGNASDQGNDLFSDGGPSLIDPVVSEANDPTSWPIPGAPADDQLGNVPDQGNDLFSDGGSSIIDPVVSEVNDPTSWPIPGTPNDPFSDGGPSLIDSVVSDFPEFDTPIPGDLVALFDSPDNGDPTSGPTISGLNIDQDGQPVPEPSTLFLIGAGLMGFGLLGKRFRK
jgi:hypothetical protein